MGRHRSGSAGAPEYASKPPALKRGPPGPGLAQPGTPLRRARRTRGRDAPPRCQALPARSILPATGRRHYYDSAPTNRARASTVAVSILAGPLDQARLGRSEPGGDGLPGPPAEQVSAAQLSARRCRLLRATCDSQ